MELQAMFCVNCGSPSGSIALEDKQILHCIQHWIAPRLVQANDLICTACLTAANVSHGGQECALCHKALGHRTRSHQIMAMRTDTQRYINIKNIIKERLLPLEIHASHYICHPCWQRAERAANHNSNPSNSRVQSASSDLKCVNCGINVTRMKRHILIDDRILFKVQQKVASQVVTTSDYLCDACHSLFDNDMMTTAADSILGHHNICIKCGCSVVQRRYHMVQDESHQHILNIVQNWIQPREVHSSDVICHKCFQRAEAALRAEQSGSVNIPLSQNCERINLPNYARAPKTHSRCIFPACNSTSQHLVPYAIRVRLFSDHRYYIPSSCRICNLHLESQPWSLLFEAENLNHSFTANQIEEFCELLKNDKNILDFENIERMDSHLVKYCLGLTKQQFREIEAEMPEFENRSIALAAYLMKLRTGDSDERIASLFNKSRSTINRLIGKAKNEMLERFVPHHLGYGGRSCSRP